MMKSGPSTVAHRLPPPARFALYGKRTPAGAGVQFVSLRRSSASVLRLVGGVRRVHPARRDRRLDHLGGYAGWPNLMNLVAAGRMGGQTSHWPKPTEWLVAG